MNLYGLQKMTLLDFPGVLACTVFLPGCDWRCPFCHNFELVDGSASAVLTDDEFINFLQKRKGLIEGVAITGGEPLLHKDLPQLVHRIKTEGYKVKVDTNGCHPELLNELIKSGNVDYFAMDIKNSEKKYPLTCGVEKPDIASVKSCIALLINSGLNYEFRTTVVDELHNENDFESIGKMIEGAQNYYLQRFTDRDTVPYGNLSSPSFDKMRKCLEAAAKYVASVHLRGVE